MRHGVLALAAALLVGGCGASEQPAAEAEQAPSLGSAELPPQVADFPVLASDDCVDVVQFYLEAIGGREWEQAALVWDDPVIDGARLEALFAGYEEPQIVWNEPFVEGAAGSLYCTVSGALTDAADAAKAPRQGTLRLRRANDVPGATPEQRRWTIQSSTFIERMVRSGRGAPA